MTGLVGACIVLFLLFLAALGALVYVLPEWVEERRRRKATEESAERLRQRVREVRAEADAAKDALTRCEDAAAKAAAAARKAGDAVEIANEIIQGTVVEPRP